MLQNQLHIGTGGWSWLGDLKKYTLLFRSVEINTSFYGVPKRETFERWANTVPDDFIFSVKLFQGFTHTQRLADITGLNDFISNMRALGNKLGPLLVQLPASLPFDSQVAAKFFSALREQFSGDIVCEPRNLSWFKQPVDDFLSEYQIARVAADPWRVEQASKPGGWKGVVYYRLHGSPIMYASAYTSEFLETLAPQLVDATNSAKVWCIFDNAAENAVNNARDLIDLVKQKHVG